MTPKLWALIFLIAVAASMSVAALVGESVRPMLSAWSALVAMAILVPLPGLAVALWRVQNTAATLLLAVTTSVFALTIAIPLTATVSEGVTFENRRLLHGVVLLLCWAGELGGLLLVTRVERDRRATAYLYTTQLVSQVLVPVVSIVVLFWTLPFAPSRSPIALAVWIALIVDCVRRVSVEAYLRALRRCSVTPESRASVVVEELNRSSGRFSRPFLLFLGSSLPPVCEVHGRWPLRPVLLLSASAVRSLSDAEIRAVLRHEFVHSGWVERCIAWLSAVALSALAVLGAIVLIAIVSGVAGGPIHIAALIPLVCLIALGRVFLERAFMRWRERGADRAAAQAGEGRALSRALRKLTVATGHSDLPKWRTHDSIEERQATLERTGDPRDA